MALPQLTDEQRAAALEKAAAARRAAQVVMRSRGGYVSRAFGIETLNVPVPGGCQFFSTIVAGHTATSFYWAYYNGKPAMASN